ncbi:MAG: tetratricopeptide repeat protein [Chitinivibrionales bacterium]|nr:tetratricopeptide repeat protein [Chitinivibrionales bacterium]
MPTYNNKIGMPMLKKLLDKLPFSDTEKHIIRLVLIGCCSVSGLLIMSVIGIRIFVSTGEQQAYALTLAPDDLAAHYEQRRGDILPIDVQAHQFQARHYYNTGNYRKAIEHLLRIYFSKASDDQVAIDLASAYLRAGKYRKAYSLFSELMELQRKDSYDPAIHARYALTKYYLGDEAGSTSELKKCIAQAPDAPEAYTYLAQIEATRHLPSPEAETYFEKAIQADPYFSEARYQQARYLMNIENYKAARDSLFKLLESNPLHAKAHSRLGMTYYYLLQPELAKKSLQTALTLNPDDFNARFNLGELEFTFYHDSAGALHNFRQVIALQPQHPQANFKIGLICLGNNQAKEAIKFLERARRNSLQNTRILLLLAVAYEKTSQPDRALALYHDIMEIDNLNPIARQKIKLLSNRS